MRAMVLNIGCSQNLVKYVEARYSSCDYLC
jgi:hypothetical protein